MNGVIFAAAVAALVPPLSSIAWRALYRRLGWRFHFYPGWICGAVFMGAWEIAQRQWVAVAVSAANVVVGAVLWWLSRRRRKRAPRAYGAKSRALLAAVVARMRETLKPRPVLKPAPGSAS